MAGTVRLAILSDSSKARSDVKSFSSEFSGSLTKISAVGSAIGNVIANAVTSVTGGVGSLISEVANASDATDKFKNTLSFAGLDTKTIDNVTKATKKYADQTVYDLGDIQNITAQLASNGVNNYEGLAEAAGNLNAVAGGNAQTFKSVGMVLTQTAGQGKLTTENWNQLADAIPGASGKLQEALLAAGAYTGNFRDAMSKGEVSAEEFNAALLTLGNQPVAQEAATSTSTFEGMLGNLKATIVSNLLPAIDKVKPYAERAFKWIGDVAIPAIVGFAKDAAPKVEQFVGVIRDRLLPPVERFGAFVKDTLVPKIQELAAWLVTNKDYMLPIVVAIGAIVAAWEIWNAITRVATAVQLAFNLVMSANPIMLVVLAVAALVAGLVYFFTQTETGRQIWESFTGFLSTTMDAVVAFFKNAWQWIQDAISAVWEWLKNNWPLLLGILTGPIGLAVAWIIQHWDEVTAFFKGVPQAIKNGLSAVGGFITGIFQGAIDGVKSGWDSMVGWIGGLPGRIASAASGMWDGITGAFKSAVNAIIKGWNDLRFQIDGWTTPWGQTYGRMTIDTPNIPYLGSGGITTGPMLAMIGDNPGGREAVIPLDKYPLGDTVQIYVTVAPTASPVETGKAVAQALDAYYRAGGRRVAIS